MQRPNSWQATHPGTIIDFSYSCHTTQFATTPGIYTQIPRYISTMAQTPSEASIVKLIGRKKLKMKI